MIALPLRNQEAFLDTFLYHWFKTLQVRYNDDSEGRQASITSVVPLVAVIAAQQKSDVHTYR